MINRYTLKDMGKIWTQQNQYESWLKVELFACEAWAKLGEIPSSALSNIKEKAKFTVERIDEIEKETKHDVIAFLTCVAEHVGHDSRYIHKGLTSSDVLDTSLAYRLRQAGKIILKDLDILLSVIKEKAYLHKDTVMIGRSHGIHAEPITFGLKLAVWYEEMIRNKKRFEKAFDIISCGKISGAVGTFANCPPEIEAYVCEKLELTPEPASTQVVQRDRHAEFFTTLAIIASSLEKIAVEIRHLQRTEVLEAEEFFSKGQKGSSAMPHKRNPIASENICGLVRIIRANAICSLENVALWHERDISHSSVERVIAPDSTILLDYALNRVTNILKNLIVYPKNMEKNLNLTKGLIFSQQVLIGLVESGLTREKAYKIVQTHAMECWKSNVNFIDLIKNDETIKSCLGEKKIKDIDVSYHLKYISAIFKRVFERKV